MYCDIFYQVCTKITICLFFYQSVIKINWKINLSVQQYFENYVLKINTDSFRFNKISRNVVKDVLE